MPHLRVAIRSLLREPAFSAAVIVTLVIGLGGCLAIFSVVRAVLLEPLPFPHPDQLAAVWMTNPRQGFDRDVISYPQFRDWHDESRDFFSGLAVYSVLTGNLTTQGPAREARAISVSDEFFDVLGAQTAMGRTLDRKDFEPGRHRVMVIGQSLWTSAFGSDPAVVGKTVRLNGEPYEVVGVLPAGVAYPDDAELWTPMVVLPDQRQRFEDRGSLWLNVIGRIKSGATVASAQNALLVVEKRLQQEYRGQATPDTGVLVSRLHDDVVGSSRRSLWLLQGAVIFVLLIACANVSNLLLARVSARSREIATRAALGASWRRVVAESVTETLVLAVSGGVLGLLTAMWAVDLFARIGPSQIPLSHRVNVDWTVTAVAAALCVITAMLVGLAPVLFASRVDVATTLKAGGRNPNEAGGSGRLRSALVVGQIALALVLLVGAGLLIKSFAHVLAIQTGFATKSALTARFALPAEKYPDPARRVAMWNELTRQAATLPGVDAVGAVSTVLIGRVPVSSPMAVEGRPDLPEPLASFPVAIDSATPGYFDAVGQPVVVGRVINEHDTADSLPVVVANEALARQYFGTTDVVGRRITFGNPTDPKTTWPTIVGVVRDVRRASAGPQLDARPEVYFPYSQRARSSMMLVVRTKGDPLAMTEPLREIASKLDAEIPLARVLPLSELLNARLDARVFVMNLLSAFAIMAVLLSAIGIYGVTAYSVSRRMQEFGVLVALGAQRRDVLTLVLRHGLVVVTTGSALGVAGALALTRFAGPQLFEVSPTDPQVFLAVAIGLGLCALLACWLPAARASRVDPMTVLRHE
jgi:putative ABC transport system permease protein